MTRRKELRWTPLAEETYLTVLTFILSKWTIREADKFDKRTDELLGKLVINQELCPKSRIQSFRKCVITKQSSLIYRVNDSAIELIAFIDNRSNHLY